MPGQSTFSIVISGWPAVGKTTIARALADQFNLKMYNGGDILKMLAADKGYRDATTRDDWWDTEDAKKFMDEREADPSFDKSVDTKLQDLVHRGGVVITSYTLPWLVAIGQRQSGAGARQAGETVLAHSPPGNIIKFWLKGSRENRAKRMANRDHIRVIDAGAIVSLRDEENKKIYKHLYGFNFGEDLEVFDYMLNTDVLKLEKLIEISKVIVANHVAGLAA